MNPFRNLAFALFGLERSRRRTIRKRYAPRPASKTFPVAPPHIIRNRDPGQGRRIHLTRLPAAMERKNSLWFTAQSEMGGTKPDTTPAPASTLTSCPLARPDCPMHQRAGSKLLHQFASHNSNPAAIVKSNNCPFLNNIFWSAPSPPSRVAAGVCRYDTLDVHGCKVDSPAAPGAYRLA